MFKHQNSENIKMLETAGITRTEDADFNPRT